MYHLVNNNGKGLKPLPPIRDVEAATSDDISIPDPSIDSFTAISIKQQKLYDLEFDGYVIDRRYKLIAREKSREKTSFDIGRVAKPAGFKLKYINCVGDPSRTLAVQPALAALATTTGIVDRGYVTAIAALNAMYAIGNEPKVGNLVGNTIGQLSKRPPNPTRLFSRLAQLWCYLSWCRDAEERPDVQSDNVPPVHVHSLGTIQGTMLAAVAGQDAITIQLDAVSTDHSIVLSVLNAAGNMLRIGAAHAGMAPSCLTTIIPMRDCPVHYLGADEVRRVAGAFTAEDVWFVAHELAAQWGVSELMVECFNFYPTLCYSTKDGYDEVFCAQTLSVALPVLSLVHYSLLPVVVACNAISHSDYSEEPSFAVMCYTALARNQVLSLAYAEAMWSNGSGIVPINEKHGKQTLGWLRRLHISPVGVPMPVWGLMIDYTKKLGLNIGYSSFTLNSKPSVTDDKLADLRWLLSCATASEELLDFLPNMPAAGLDAILHPKATAELLQPEVVYKLASIGEHNNCSTYTLLLAVGAEIAHCVRRNGTMNWTTEDVIVYRNYRDVIAERPVPVRYEEADHKQADVIKIPTAADSLAAYDRDQEFKGWTWYISGTTGAIQTDVLDMDVDPPTKKPFSGFVPPNRPPTSIPESASAQEPKKMEPPATIQPTIPVTDTAIGDASTQTPKLVRGGPAVEQIGPVIPADPVASKAPVVDKVLTVPVLSLKHKAQYAMAGDRKLSGPYASVLKLATDLEVLGAPEYGNMESYSCMSQMDKILLSLSSTTLADSLLTVPRKLRSNTASVIADRLIKLASVAPRAVYAKELVDHAVRAQAVASALNINSSLVYTELVDEHYSLTPEAVQFLKKDATNLVNSGVALSVYAAEPSTGVSTKFYKHGSQAVQEAELSGYRRSKDQKGSAPGEVKMYKPLISKPVPLPAGHLGIFGERAESMKKAATALADILVGKFDAAEEARRLEKAGIDPDSWEARHVLTSIPDIKGPDPLSVDDKGVSSSIITGSGKTITELQKKLSLIDLTGDVPPASWAKVTLPPVFQPERPKSEGTSALPSSGPKDTKVTVPPADSTQVPVIGPDPAVPPDVVVPPVKPEEFKPPKRPGIVDPKVDEAKVVEFV